MKRSVWPYLLGAFGVIYLTGYVGRAQDWSRPTVFLAQAAFLLGLAVARRGATRLVMLVLIAVQAIPVYGPGTVLLVAVALYVVTLPLRWRVFVSRLSRWQLDPRPDRALAEDARPFFAQYRELGFQAVGAADARGPGFETIFTYLVSPDRRTYAILTDQVQTIASRFGNRVLVTMDRASLPVPPNELRQLVKADVPGLFEHHQSALATVAERGLRPDPINVDGLAEQVVAHEKHSIEYVARRPWRSGLRVLIGLLTRRRPDSDLIGLDPARIERWARSDGYLP